MSTPRARRSYGSRTGQDSGKPASGVDSATMRPPSMRLCKIAFPKRTGSAHAGQQAAKEMERRKSFWQGGCPVQGGAEPHLQCLLGGLVELCIAEDQPREASVSGQFT